MAIRLLFAAVLLIATAGPPARAVEPSERLADPTLEARARWEGDRVPPGLLRLAVGLEDPDALWADLEQALGP